jgi:hypothetical protein
MLDFSSALSDVMLFLKTTTAEQKKEKLLKHISLPNLRQMLPLYMTGGYSETIAAAAFSLPRQDLTTAGFSPQHSDFLLQRRRRLLQFFVPVRQKS